MHAVRVLVRSGGRVPVHVVGICIVEYGVLEALDLSLDFVLSKRGLELREVVDGALAVSRCNNVLWVLPNVFSDFAPGSFDCCD